MTYLLKEYAGGEPIELYQFVRAGAMWLYTSADYAITHNGQTYQPVVIARGAIAASDEANSGSVDVSCDSGLSIIPQFVQGVVPSPLWLTIFRMHQGDSDAVVIFQGQVSSAVVTGREATLHCTPTRRAMEKNCPRILYQRQCNHFLYDVGCKLDPNSFKTTGQITATAGPVLTVNTAVGLGTDWFTGGYLQIPGTEVRAFITKHDDATGDITLLQLVPGLAVGVTVDLYAGCDRLEETCHVKFGNIDNFLGFPDIPNQNPFSQVL